MLVVDDDPDTLDVNASILRQAGADIVAAGSVAEALQVLAQPPLPHVILSDIAMPGHDGYELLRQLRARSPIAGGNVPVIAVTAFGDVAPEPGLRFSGVLRKPVPPDLLVHVAHATVRPVEVVAYVRDETERARLEEALARVDRSTVLCSVTGIADASSAALEEDGVTFTPTLVRRHPTPRAWLLGDFANTDKLAATLEAWGARRLR